MFWLWAIVEPFVTPIFKSGLSLIGKSFGDKIKPHIDDRFDKILPKSQPDTEPTEPPKETNAPTLTLPDESQGIRWRCKWEGNRITKMDPVCPNPNCGRDLRITQAGGQYGSDAVFVCDSAGCGFNRRFEDIPAVVLADS
jgi:hypothetical protein